MKSLRSHWLWFFALLTMVSGLDYWDHISRPGSAFEAAPWGWLGFTLAAHLSLCVTAFGAAYLLARLHWPALLSDTLAIGIAIAAHLIVTGPLWDRVFWSGQLVFDSVLIPVIVGCVLYLLFRFLFRFAAMLRIRPPQRLP